MNAYEFMNASPWLTFFLALFVVVPCLKSLVWLAGLPFRAMNIRKHGWPPAHLDADGDYKAHMVAEAMAKAAKEHP